MFVSFKKKPRRFGVDYPPDLRGFFYYVRYNNGVGWCSYSKPTKPSITVMNGYIKKKRP